jgi:hypothetical protein
MWHLKIKPGSHADRGAKYFKINAEIVKKTRLYICGYCAVFIPHTIWSVTVNLGLTTF